MLWTDWNINWRVVGANHNDGDRADMIIRFVDASFQNRGELILHPRLDDALRDLYGRGSYSGKPGEAVSMPTLGLLQQPYALFVGCERAPMSEQALRNVAGTIGNKLLELKAGSADIVVPAGQPAASANALMEGLLLGLYRRNSLAVGGREQAKLERVSFLLEEGADIEAWQIALQRGYIAANAVCYARELTNVPSNRLTPELLAGEARALSERYGFDCTIYDEKTAAAEGMGGLLAVGMGSVNPPRMIVLRYGGDPGSGQSIGLIGKGITFDTGGVSLKKAEGMEEMISDMGGAAAVLGAMRAIGELKPKVNVVMVVPAAENMPSGSAFKPGDVLTAYGGQTVEVLNTDAEGRIVLADGVTTAIRFGATKLIDVATLTGAVMHALGDLATGAFTSDESMLGDVLQAASRAGEYVWQLPLHPEYDRLLKSDVADVKNHGGSWAGAIAGALFVRHFTEGKPWVHLDIGGTAWMWSDRGFESKGGTGVMVRTLAEYIRLSAD
ncbi:leucyl aminopeptidase [Cohnella panacarvi]|uniref:leucyl aminopeptidase n=1 Tax=Cohnella panacarvi TaxID=400776 RepID=UPI00047C35B9|nr:leucyl aminopeptidase [Cohnella panacarvi]